jgi:hypothetical protein
MKQEEIINLIDRVITSYERMLQAIVIERDKEFNSQPYEQSLDALNYVLKEMKEKQND